MPSGAPHAVKMNKFLRIASKSVVDILKMNLGRLTKKRGQDESVLPVGLKIGPGTVETTGWLDMSDGGAQLMALTDALAERRHLGLKLSVKVRIDFNDMEVDL